MKFVYFGSFRVSADILGGILDAGLTPVAVVASPDRIAGKKKVMTPPAVKQLLAQRNLSIPLLQPEKPTDVIDQLAAYGADVFVVMGYPHILPEEILSLPPRGTIGIHPSLLPLYRGASPMQTALLEGVEETGVTLYMIDARMDHGPIISQCIVPISETETNTSLEKKLAKEAAGLFARTYKELLAGAIQLTEQDHSKATYTKKFSTVDAEVDMLTDSAITIYRKIQALTPEPGVWTRNFPGREGKRVKLLSATLRGDVIHISKIQVEGKLPVDID